MERPPLSSSSFHRLRRYCLILARAFLAGPWERQGLVERGRATVQRKAKWLDSAAKRAMEAFPTCAALREARLADHLAGDPDVLKAATSGRVPLRPQALVDLRPEMRPPPGPSAAWSVPAIATPAELAAFCDVSPVQLEGLADCQGRERRTPREPLRNYRYRAFPKASGGFRIIEAPKPRLRRMQRLLLDEILAKIPAHEAAHGFRPGRSVMSFVERHVGRHVVLKMDLADFFPSITAARVLAIFMTAGYPEDVAKLLAGLCTNAVPMHLERLLGGTPVGDWRSRKLLAGPHLPQGAPTSPALANLAAYRLDLRLDALARSAGAHYTRYADDMVFSGDESFARSAGRFALSVSAIALEEGLAVRNRKTRVMRRGVRQRAAGIVLNERPKIPRDDYDKLKATLHNCLRHGPAGQNRDGHMDFRAHLLGRIAYVARIHPGRGERLMRSFDRITW
ncbi:Reverse transcriptase (RNA-dependent DNA polymerase) [Aquisphaera giovannonii]|uniref:RNA-directed DNA polymerase n=1 Tax=Aquisphaera giovannonii TaxID=406548 RepID=A0A5B9W999_9BACT|nr:reverse transcriptase family protein [Aquisphaera giovannonii]QEH37007.1 Reverse transcriptase (RNA-dependent DNA polymerase) [Aquisphaera giovannonii]